MTNERFDMTVSAWLHEDAAARLPDHLGAVLAVTSRTRQRPAWSSLERWLPLDTTIRPAMTLVARPVRLIIMAALPLALVGLVIVAVGSRQPPPPEPFGLARNGTFVTSYDGDIYTVDPDTGDTTPLVAGDAFDFGPVFARDGSKFMFLRSDGPPEDPAFLTLMVANADGSGVHGLSAAMRALDWFDWSPDGTRIAFNSAGNLYLADATGGGLTRLGNRTPAHFVTWLPPAGERLIFRAETLQPAIYEILPDGTGQRQITPDGASRFDYQSPVASHDGTRLSYTRIVNNLQQVFLLDLATGVETRLPNADGATQLGQAWFSPDGASVAYVRQFANGEYQVVIAPADGSGDGRVLGPRMPSPAPGVGINVWMTFAPDGASLLVRYGGDDGGTTHRLPIDGSQGTIVAAGTFHFVDVQRLRP